MTDKKIIKEAVKKGVNQYIDTFRALAREDCTPPQATEDIQIEFNKLFKALPGVDQKLLRDYIQARKELLSKWKKGRLSLK